MAFITIGKKEDPRAPSSQSTGETPLNKVSMMKQQSLSDNQIIQTLQREGYTSQQIFDAMSQAELKGTVSGAAPMPNIPIPQQMPQQQFQPQFQQSPTNLQDDILRDKMESVAEAIVDEKWQELIEQVNRIIEWKESSEKRIIQVEQRFEDLQKSFDKVHTALIERIEDNQKSMSSVGTDVKAMSTVFQKILPGFVQNVSELSRIADKMGARPNPEKKQLKKDDIFSPAGPIEEEQDDTSVEDKI